MTTENELRKLEGSQKYKEMLRVKGGDQTNWNWQINNSKPGTSIDDLLCEDKTAFELLEQSWSLSDSGESAPVE